MLKWLTYIPEVIAAISIGIPMLRTLVEQFETPGFGPEKKTAVLEALRKGLAGFKIRESIIDMLVSGAGGIIDTVVFFKNLIGEFVHKNEEGT